MLRFTQKNRTCMPSRTVCPSINASWKNRSTSQYFIHKILLCRIEDVTAVYLENIMAYKQNGFNHK